MTTADYEAHFGGNGYGRNSRLVSGQSGAGSRTFGRFADNGLRSSVPVPKEYGAVFRSGSDVAVGCDVALGSAQTRDDSKMAVDDLDDFGRVRGEDAETVVPETGCHEEPAVHGRQETVGAQFDFLAEIVAQVASG